VIVIAASVRDRDAACRLLALLGERFFTIAVVWADGGYARSPGESGVRRAGHDGHYRQAQ
jgi:hypothetical protein